MGLSSFNFVQWLPKDASKRRVFCAPECVLAVHGCSGSSKVDDFGTNRKRVCDFLLVRRCDYLPIEWWNFRSRTFAPGSESSTYGTFVPGNKNDVELSLPIPRATKSWNFRTQSETHNLIVWSATKIKIATVQISNKTIYFSCTCTYF